MSPNVAGALAYPLGLITGILFLKIDPYKYDPFVRFHAFQSIFLSLFYGLLIMAWDAFVGLVFDARLGFLWGLILPLYSLLRLVMILLGFFLMYKAFKYERFSLPLKMCIRDRLKPLGDPSFNGPAISWTCRDSLNIRKNCIR